VSDERIKHVRLYPELALFHSNADRKAAMRKFQRSMWKTRRFWLLMLFSTLGFLAFNLTLVSLRGFAPIPPAMIGGLAGGINGALIGFSFQFVFRAPLRRHLREELLKQNIPVCLKCGYDLRGQTEPRCPECGEAFNSKLLTSTES